MRIAYVLPQWPPDPTEPFVVNEMVEVQEAGHEIVVAALYAGKDAGVRHGTYARLRPSAVLPPALFDLRDVLVALRKQGIVDGHDFIGGFELGAEVAGGAGSLRIDALGHTFSAYAITAGDDTLTGTEAGDLEATSGVRSEDVAAALAARRR